MVTQSQTVRSTAISTVNVIEFSRDSPTSIVRMSSFPDTPEGNKDAEADFHDWVNELAGTDLSEEEMSDRTTDGFYEMGEATILIVHSTEPLKAN